MKRVEENGDWTLMCPNECPGLSDVHGKDFEKLYKKYESKEREENLSRLKNFGLNF